MKPLRLFKYFLTTACMAALSGCAVGPDYKMPEFDLPSFWHEAKPNQNVSASDQAHAWWEDFNDPIMCDLVKRALDHNESLAVAEARISEVRGLRESAFGALFPQIGADAQAVRENPGVSTTNHIIGFEQGAFDAAWEIDLFGGTRRRIEAEDALTGAAVADYRDISLSLAAEVAREYIILRQLQAQLAVTRQTADIQSHLYNISQDRYKGGLVSTLDVAQAETLYKTTIAHIPDFERLIKATSYRISLLLGESPGSVDQIAETAAPIPSAQQLPVLEAPADIMRRRPDIAVAERNLAAATASQGVAISELYPKISLAGLFGTQYGTFPLYKYAATHRVWEMGAGISMPILNFGTIEGQINAADARQVQAYHNYRQTVLAALSDVETDLSNLALETKRDDVLHEASKAADHAVDVARDRYRNGLTDFTSVLQSEQQRFSVQLDMLASQSDEAQDVIALHKALGDNPVSPSEE
ncbi:MAG: efflux transporter outer membrane subunit [Alphaproteobacteria bacterium]